MHAHFDALFLHPSADGLFHECPFLLAELGDVERPFVDGLLLAETFGADKLERPVLNVEIDVEVRGGDGREGVQQLAMVDIAVWADLPTTGESMGMG